jgi:hypothetical protein
MMSTIGALSAWMLLALAAGNAAPHRDERAPTNLSLCSALFFTNPSITIRPDRLLYDLNGTRALVLRIQRAPVDDNTLKSTRPNKYQMKIGLNALDLKLPRTDGKYDWSEPHDQRVVLSTYGKTAVGGLKEFMALSVLGRIDQLIADFTNENFEGMAFGYELRGSQAILNYLESVEQLAASIDVVTAPAIDKKDPLVAPARILKMMSPFLLIALWDWWILPADPLHATGHPVRWVLAALGTVFPGMEAVYSLQAYLRAIFSKSGRAHWENSRDRSGWLNLGLISDMKAMAAGAAAVPDGLIFNGITIYNMPGELLKELAAAQSEQRMPRVETLVAGALHANRGRREIMRDRQVGGRENHTLRLLLDQALFFDNETNEPVLVSLLRMKKSLAGGTPRRRQRDRRAFVFEDLIQGLPGFAGGR